MTNNLSENLKNFKNNFLNNPEKPGNRRWLLISVLVTFFVLAIFISFLFIFEGAYAQKFYPGSRIGTVNISGLNREQALDLLDKKTTDLSNNGFMIIIDGQEAGKLASVLNASNVDLTRDIFTFDNYQTIQESFLIGRNGNFLNNLWQQFLILTHSLKFEQKYNLDNDLLIIYFTEQFKSIEKDYKNSEIKVTWDKNNYSIEILPETNGVMVDYNKLVNLLEKNLKNLDDKPLKSITSERKSEISASIAEQNKNKIEQVLTKDKIIFTYKDKKWNLSNKDLSSMLEFKFIDQEIKLGVNRDKFITWLDKNISNQITIEPIDAKVKIVDGKVTKINAHRAGIKLNKDQVYNDLENILASPDKEVALMVEEILPKTAITDINDMGIAEIIGTGTSNFAGSPNNRRHNIKNGAEKLNGLLIAPNEEFSIIKALGPVEAETGYLPELVIKDNKTIPEYGGGLCQIGTTLFRAAMGSGLPILERRNHSYSVTYYLENGLPGVDATIYIPKPDVRFKNDTGNYILIQTYIKGNDLFFEFWGTKDGRLGERTKPKVWGWVNPPPTKIVETTDLPPGQKKCTESSHKGVNASFDYTITYANGSSTKQTFTSHYKPWQAVCLVGVAKNSSATSTTNSTSTINQ